MGPFAPELEHPAPSVIERPAMDKPGPCRSEPGLLALMVVEEPIAEKLDPTRPDSESMTIVVLDEPAAKRPILHYDLTTGFGERLQQRLYETIELNCSSIQGEQSKGVQREPEMEVASKLVPSPDVERSDGVLPDEGEANSAPRGEPDSSDLTEGDSTNKVVLISTCPPNYAEMEEMLRQIPRGFDADLPHLKMFETAKMVLFHSFDLSARSRCTFFGRYLTSLIYIFCCSW